MTKRTEYREALDIVREHRARAARAARVPWWVYPAMFVLVGGVAFALGGAGGVSGRPSAVIVLILFAAVFVLAAVFGHAPLDRLRAVTRRQSFRPRVFGVITVLGVVGLWIATRFGGAIAGAVAGVVGMSGHPSIIAGVLAGGAFTVLFALGRLLSAVAGRAGR